MVINFNQSAAFASRMEGINTANVLKTSKELSSGMRINSAADDSSGLAVSEKMRSQIRGLNQASRNVMNGVSMLQTAEGYMQSTTDILQRIRELAVQSANGIYSDEDRAMLQTEVEQLVSEVDRISQTAEFNGMTLLSGRFAEDGIRLQVGANVDQNFTVKLGDMSASALGLKGAGQDGTEQAISLANPESANMALATVDEALKTVNKSRADIGASMNRMEMAQKGIDIASENLAASESRIRDADMAKTITDHVKNQILQQASNSLLAQSVNIGRDFVATVLR
jgi:flagellin